MRNIQMCKRCLAQAVVTIMANMTAALKTDRFLFPFSFPPSTWTHPMHNRTVKHKKHTTQQDSDGLTPSSKK